MFIALGLTNEEWLNLLLVEDGLLSVFKGRDSLNIKMLYIGGKNLKTFLILAIILSFPLQVVLVQQEGLQYWKSCLKAYARPDMWINCG